MLISYYANKKSSPRLPLWQPSLIFFSIPIESGSIIKPCTLKHFQVTYRLHKAGYWTIWLDAIRYQAITWTNVDLNQCWYQLSQCAFNCFCDPMNWQATGLDAWASRVKFPARFVSHLHEICIYIWVVCSLCFFCCLFITVTWWYMWCIEWASGNQEEVQACLVTLWLFIISCYSLYKTTLGLLCSWFENNPHFHKYSIDFHV